MIELKIDGPKGIVNAKVEGTVLDLLAEIPVAFGHVMGGVLKTCPDEKLRAELTKQIFELTLREMEDCK